MLYFSFLMADLHPHAVLKCWMPIRIKSNSAEVKLHDSFKKEEEKKDKLGEMKGK